MCGVCANCFKLVTEEGDERVFEALEDEQDGYRSSLAEVREVTDPVQLSALTFSPSPYATVIGSHYSGDDFEGIMLVDETDDHVWLQIGTEKLDDYYPCFIFSYAAKDPRFSAHKQ